MRSPALTAACSLLALATSARAAGPCERADEAISVLRLSSRHDQLAVRHQIDGCSERDDGSGQRFGFVFVDLYRADGKLTRRFLWEGDAAALSALKTIDGKRLPVAIRPYLTAPLGDRRQLERQFAAGKFVSVEAAASGPDQRCTIEPRLREPAPGDAAARRELAFSVVRDNLALPLEGAPFEVGSGALAQQIFWLKKPWIAIVASETGGWSPDGAVSWQAIRFFRVPAARRGCFM